MNPTEFKQALLDLGIELDAHQMEQYEDYFQLLVDFNAHTNLTAITEKKEVYLKHFFDSILTGVAVSQLQNKPLTLCDVGAGAGFPSIPLKIAFPDLKVTIVDSLNKRILFLDQLANNLGLTGVSFYHARAEEFAGKKSQYRESFDIVTARAVARLNVLAELCLPLVKVGGSFVALKAQKAHAELDEAQFAIKTLGGEFVQDNKLVLPITSDERHIIKIDKVKKTPAKYPRKAGTPGKQPLVG
ncbi:16S rRNA (guanine(527)-N(7))-methyltransferase RsmG [Liquorilactobacillus mali]|uniref:Ribosomal RNA small subunit methyltransferase G n=1 Tax=Liquorilactobacillus mali KCTC 3596 = DSM 20444 TaxID=1046596 RepID=A0A0R2EFN6_9LACO|nr:16S rRNA (guanine(527)-N(7))-methyltransferase RsmG [Liquorilactobacillus mali]KRN11085.1 16S rRNA methyltransferase GidB [Liquorilactobacillus mali KCTC 3596 = DSM 20444]QFQ75579.1 16S rRNA (guanine(527)-N(7))-methyltransferase RsmG [Liquorilactobacillus mali]